MKGYIHKVNGMYLFFIFIYVYFDFLLLHDVIFVIRVEEYSFIDW